MHQRIYWLVIVTHLRSKTSAYQFQNAFKYIVQRHVDGIELWSSSAVVLGIRAKQLVDQHCLHVVLIFFACCRGFRRRSSNTKNNTRIVIVKVSSANSQSKLVILLASGNLMLWKRCEYIDGTSYCHFCHVGVGL